MLKPANDATWTKRTAAHLLNRAGFGGSPGEVDKLHAMGRKQAVAHLLDTPDESELFPEPEWMGAEEIEANRREFRKQRRAKTDKSMTAEERAKARRAAQRKRRADQRGMTQESIDLWFRRMHASRAQTREKMTLFWHGHFATSIQKVKSPVLMHGQNQLFRRRALGNFKTLTNEICDDPAMMLYLDTDKNAKGKPNENFARELLELFTLGEGNYTEQDVAQAARAFTGYQLNRYEGKARFIERRHDGGVKEFMGESGEFKPEDIVDIVFGKPRCSEFIVAKIWEFFAYEAPEDEIVKQLAEGFQESGHEVKPLLEVIFLSEAFNSPKAARSQIKSPVQFIVQMARELELPRIPGRLANNAMQQLGQVLYRPPNVAGWEGGRSWITTNTLLTRYNIAGFLLKGGGDRGGNGNGKMKARREQGKKAGRRARADRGGAVSFVPFNRIAPVELREDDAALIAALTERLFHAALAEKDVEKFRDYARSKESRRFTDREVGELIHLMMSSPQYQLA